eukprot:PRCOL_00003319-RA
MRDERGCEAVANERVKRLVKLRTSHRARRETGSALLVGADVIAECVVRVAGDSAVQPRRLRTLLVRDGAEQHADAAELLAAARAQGSARGARVPTFLASDDVMNKVAGVGSADGVVAVAEVEVPAAGDAASAPDWAASMNRVLALDTVQDPGNVGTLLRTALALGWGGALMLGDCCDVFNDKCLRAGRGAAAKLPTLRVGDSKAGAGAALRALQAEGFTVVAAEPPRDEHEAAAARDVLQALSAEHRVCLVLGSEGQGLSAEAKAACAGGSVSVPQDPGSMESLNVGVAGGILMYALGSGAEAAD